MQSDSFVHAFKAWAESNFGLAKASREVYETIWNAFSEQAGASTPAQVEASDIERYLNARPQSAEGLTLRYQARVVMLIDKVLAHDAESAGRKSPKAVKELLKHRPALREAMMRHRKDSPDLEYLAGDEHARLVDVLTAWPRDAGRVSTAPRWQDARDRTSVALQLAGGLSPADIRCLEWRAAEQSRRTTAADGSRALRVPKNGRLSKRTARLDAWAVPLLDGWLDLFEEHDLQSDWLFPGRKDSVEPWSKPAQHGTARDIMRAAGIEGSSFKLRHTWALKILAAGADEGDVARWLGVLDDEVMSRYGDALEDFRASW